MSALVLDTHTAVWYLLKSPRLSVAAFESIDRALAADAFLYVSAVSILEIVYLVEKGRLPETALERFNEVLGEPGAHIRVAPLDLAVALAARSIPRETVPDMPDRIIAATALHLRLPLVTRDSRIKATEIQTIW